MFVAMGNVSTEQLSSAATDIGVIGLCTEEILAANMVLQPSFRGLMRLLTIITANTKKEAASCCETVPGQ